MEVHFNFGMIALLGADVLGQQSTIMIAEKNCGMGKLIWARKANIMDRGQSGEMDSLIISA